MVHLKGWILCYVNYISKERKRERGCGEEGREKGRGEEGWRGGKKNKREGVKEKEGSSANFNMQPEWKAISLEKGRLLL